MSGPTSEDRIPAYQLLGGGTVLLTELYPEVGSSHVRAVHLAHADALDRIAARCADLAAGHRRLVAERDAEHWA